jgi:hypothetical protein
MLHEQFGVTPGLSESSMFGGRAWLPGREQLGQSTKQQCGVGWRLC